MRRKSIRSGRSDRRPGCVSSQRSKGSARASSRLRRQRPSGPGAVTSACKPACSRPRRSDASVAGPRAVCSRGALASNVSSSMLKPRRRVGARARPWPAPARSATASTARPAPARRSRPACALARRQSEPITRRARAAMRLRPCRERRRRQGPEREAHERLAGAAPCGARGAGASRRLGARRIRRPGRRLDPVWRAPSGAGSRRAPGAISTSNAPSA